VLSVHTKTIEYNDGDTVLEGFMAWDDSHSDSRPGVLVSHAWRGRSTFEEDKAVRLAEAGYIGFALDVYGKGVLGSTAIENRQLMQPLLDDRVKLQSRMQLAVDVLRQQEEVDSSRVAALGYCFGGLCVLDLARMESDVLGVASFHGLFGAPENTIGNKVTAKVLVMHGWDDPMAPPEHVTTLARELTALNADWQIHAYGNTQHAFTNPAANDSVAGTIYSEDADRRSWQSMQLFLSELF